MSLSGRSRLRSTPHRWIARLTATLAAVGLTVPLLAAALPAAADDGADHGAPDAIAADYYGALLRHTRWVESVWDANAGVYQLKDFNFAVVLGNAVLLKYGEYDASVTGISKDELREHTLATITHYAASNRFVDPNGTWGKKMFWDSTFQSYFLAAGKVMWNDLDGTTRENLETIATGQSRYTAGLNFGNDPLSGSWTADWPDGKYLGDTAQEEAGVYTQALAPGLAWAPQDAAAGQWSEQLGDWIRNAAGQPTADKNNPAIVAGKPISSNTMHTIHDTYLVENHGSFGPHYQSDLWRSGARNAIHFLLNDEPLPEALTRQPNSAELWESIKLVMSAQGEPFMPMVADREFLYGRDVLPMAFLGQVLRDPDAARAEASLAAALEDYQSYEPVYRLAKFSGEPKYEPEARAEIAISYLLHVKAAESEAGSVEPTAPEEFFERLSGVRDFGAVPGITVQQTSAAWAAASSRKGFVKFPWVPAHNSWLFSVSGASPFLYPNSGATVDERKVSTYSDPRDGFEGTSSVFRVGEGYAGQVTLPTGSALYASSGGSADDASLSVRNLDMNGYAGLDGSRTYTSVEGEKTASLPVVRPASPDDAKAARVDDHDFEPVTARYVRMQGQQGDPRYGYSMFSFHVYGPDATSADDLAAGKSAQASSEDTSAPNRRAGAVTDRNADTRWAVSTGERTRADSWVQVDLGADTEIGGVRLAWEVSAGSRYLVQTSSDGQNWKTQASYSQPAADANVARLDTVDLAPSAGGAPSPVTTRFVRMQGVQGDPDFGYSLYHLRAFTPAGTDAAAGKPATASSADSGRPASAATDGSPTTRWAVSRDARPRADSWVQVDLGSPVQISQVQLGWESAAGREYRIQTSLDGTTWHDAASFRYTGDQILRSEGSWLNVEGTAGFVVRGSNAPITVSREKDERQRVRLADGTHGPVLVEMVAGDADVTRRQAGAKAATTDAAGVLVSTIDGYLTAFNLTGADVTTTVRVPHTGGEVPLFAGTQRVTAKESQVEVSIPAGSATVLAPRMTVSVDDASTTLTARLDDARTAQVSADRATGATLRSIQTGESRSVGADRLAAGTTVRFGSATVFPVRDLALSTLTFPASVLPEGMTSPALAVDGDPATVWTPGPDGRMVTDLGAPRTFGSIATEWDGERVPDFELSTSDDGITFRPAESSGRSRAEVSEVTARYVAISTGWREGDASLAALQVLEPGAAADEAPGAITGDLPAWLPGQEAGGAVGASGSPAPEFAVTAGALPEGVALDAATGAFSGIPVRAGAFEFTVRADNGVGEPATRAFRGTVGSAPGEVVPSLPPTPGEANPAGLASAGASGGAPAGGATGQLPATGLDLGVLPLAGALLLGFGLAISLALGGIRSRRTTAQ